jgi:hypothetical protein
MIRYHHLVANLLIFHNVVTMTKALQALAADGVEIDEAGLACVSPDQTEHINRFGRYTSNGTASQNHWSGFRVVRMPTEIRRTASGKD